MTDFLRGKLAGESQAEEGEKELTMACFEASATSQAYQHLELPGYDYLEGHSLGGLEGLVLQLDGDGNQGHSASSSSPHRAEAAVEQDHSFDSLQDSCTQPLSLFYGAADDAYYGVQFKRPRLQSEAYPEDSIRDRGMAAVELRERLASANASMGASTGETCSELLTDGGANMNCGQGDAEEMSFRDFPHPRHVCVVFPFVSTPSVSNSAHCSKVCVHSLNFRALSNSCRLQNLPVTQWNPGSVTATPVSRERLADSGGTGSTAQITAMLRRPPGTGPLEARKSWVGLTPRGSWVRDRASRACLHALAP